MTTLYVSCRAALASGRRAVYVLFNNVAVQGDARRFRASLARK